MDDEERAQAFAQIRATLEQRNNVEPEPEPWPRRESGPSQNDHRYRYGIALADPHGLDRWRADAEAQELRFEKQRAAREQREAESRRQQQVQAMSSDANWNRWIDRKIARALDSSAFNGLQTDVLGAVVAEIRHQLRDEFRRELGEYGRRGDETVRALREEIAVAKAHDTVIDLPKGSWRRDVA
jgi:hypothetical protein